MLPSEVKTVIEDFESETHVDFLVNVLNSPFGTPAEAWTALEERIAETSESRFGCYESGHRHHTTEEAESCKEASRERWLSYKELQ